MNSLRLKITLTLILMSLMSVMLLGATTQKLILDNFDRAVAGRAVERVSDEIVAYYTTFGSWEAARNAMSFREFNQQKMGGQSAASQPRRAYPRDPYAPSSEASSGGPRRPPEQDRPTRMYLVNSEREVLLPMATMEVGYKVSRATFKNAVPIYNNDEILAYVLMGQSPQLTEIEQNYLDSVKTAWVYSMVGASLFAVMSGIFLGGRLTRPITRLSDAMQSMHKGDLRQNVPILSEDELGKLSEHFNSMSGKLATAYEELETSKEKLASYAMEMKELSGIDELTQLRNRRSFMEHLLEMCERASRYEHPLTVGMIDLDHFKQINDQHGHNAGDIVLQEFSRIIGDNLRRADLSARWGGEEFIIAFPETDLSTARILSERLRELIETHHWGQVDENIKLTISIGLAAFDHKKGMEDMIKLSDDMLYKAKGNGRNQVVS